MAAIATLRGRASPTPLKPAPSKAFRAPETRAQQGFQSGPKPAPSKGRNAETRAQQGFPVIFHRKMGSATAFLGQRGRRLFGE